MNKREALHQLFTEWEAAVPVYKGAFIRDGIVNEAAYEKARPRVLFISKETNLVAGKPAYDYSEMLSQEPGNMFVKRLAQWAYGFQHKWPAFEQLSGNKDAAIWVDVLAQIAFLDVKKSGGTGKANDREIEQHIVMNRPWLQKQIEIIDPDVIVCTLRSKALVMALFELSDKQWVQTPFNRCVFKYGSAAVVDFYHPSGRRSSRAFYELLKGIVVSEAFMGLCGFEGG